MASSKILDRFLAKLEELAVLGNEVARFTELVAQHESRAFRAILDRVRPIMEIIDSPIPTREEWVASDEPGDKQTFYYRERGVILVNNFESTIQNDRDRMSYSGYKIVFTRSGKLIRLDRTGSWSVGNRSNFWSSEAHEVDCDAEFAERHLEEGLTSVVHAVDRAQKRQREHRKKLRRRLKLLRAVAYMLEKEVVPPTLDPTPIAAE
jgi:hypothetical protein